MLPIAENDEGNVSKMQRYAAEKPDSLQVFVRFDTWSKHF